MDNTKANRWLMFAGCLMVAGIWVSIALLSLFNREQAIVAIRGILNHGK